jgi:CRP-like cAMP-binding protein
MLYEVDRFDCIVPLPRGSEIFLPHMSGSLTVREIVRIAMDQTQQVPFKSLVLLLQRLKDNGALRNPDDLPLDLQLTESSFGVRSHFWAKSFFQFPITESRRVDLRSQPLFFLFAFLFTFGSLSIAFMEDLRPFDLVFGTLRDSPARGLAFMWLAISGLASFKSIVKMILLVAGTGRLPTSTMVVAWWGITFRVNDDSATLLLGPNQMIIYTVTAWVAPLFVVFVEASIGTPIPVLEHLTLLCMLLAIFQSDPFARSDLTRLFRRYSLDMAEGDLRNYLRAYRVKSSADGLAIAQLSILGVFLVSVLAWVLIAFSTILGAMSNLPLVSLTYWPTDTREILDAGALLIEWGLMAALLTSLLWDVASTWGQKLAPVADRMAAVLRQPLRRFRKSDFSPELIRAALEQIPLFSGIEDTSLESLVSKGLVQSFRNREPLILQGTRGHEMYILLSGQVRIEHHDNDGRPQTLAHLVAPCALGELALLENEVRSADVIAEGNVVCLALSSKVLQPWLDSEKRGDANQILKRVQLQRVLSASGVFSQLPRESLQLVTAWGKFEAFQDDQVICYEGEKGDDFFIVVRGAVEVQPSIRPKNAPPIMLKQGDFFGEVSILTHKPRSATVIARHEAILYKIPSDVLWNVLATNLNLALSLEHIAESRRGQDAKYESIKPPLAS